MKPFLSGTSVTDEALLRKVNKITNEESERRQRLGRNKPTKAIYAESGEVGLKKAGDCKEDTHRTDKDEEMQKLTTKVQALTQMVESLKQWEKKKKNVSICDTEYLPIIMMNSC